jgi:hypothetical protein
MAGTTRVTLVLPEDLWEETQTLIPRGKRSRFVAEALEAAIRKERNLLQLVKLNALHERMPPPDPNAPTTAELINQMWDERDEQIAGNS